ncbi:probable E3 ubiquitin-protein ligase sinah [Bacillus rossius redtenbacheri]|uniref:probable E3 ubiquitin-protein ligase sinah n=1 Tax=Bacillus rossius redtenbacheri TaxID=93214 RepID=UPI002FDD4715
MQDPLDAGEDYLDHQILRLLECPVCEERMAPPMILCAGGHSVCGPCRTMVVNCPLCYRAFTQARDFLLEAVFEELVPVACPHQRRGCCHLAVARELADHVAACPHGDLRCPVDGCLWAGPRSELRRHALRSHPRRFIEGADTSATLRLDEDCHRADLLSAHGELFVVSRSVLPAGEATFSMELLGAGDRARGFWYEVRLGGRDLPGPTASYRFPVLPAGADETFRVRADTALLRCLAPDGVLRCDISVMPRDLL